MNIFSKKTAYELEKNSINLMTSRFDQLLYGLDTKKGKFTSLAQKNKIINSIKDYIKYREEEKIINQDSEIWKIFMKIKKLNFNSVSEIKKIYSELLELKFKFHYTKKSIYYKQKGREIKMEKGQKGFKDFLGGLFK
ncbi:MAG: hypothetical protein PVJ67_03275 [Candidatus Pacearchaeota archaeon]|jgi:hypothetical protein